MLSFEMALPLRSLRLRNREVVTLHVLMSSISRSITVSMTNGIFIAIGSNVGDRVYNIHAALTMLNERGILVKSTGFLYESDPMYLLDQPTFLNTCVQVETQLSAPDLLIALKSIESSLGRQKVQRNGPRNIDLDIVLFNDEEHSSETLDVPHPRMSERAFVLLPLADISKQILHPQLEKTVAELLIDLGDLTSCRRVIPTGLPNSVIPADSKSVIVGILNVTPDSFSDGGKYMCLDAAIAHATAMVVQGADIIDIGGESTRPTAEKVDEQEEMSRVVDVVKQVRHALPDTPISIDTYRASTARRAVEAGASIVNDVSGGMLDPDMLATVASLNKPYICTHAGRIGTHTVIDYKDGQPSCLDSSMKEDVIVNILRSQLAARVHACMAAGIARWNIILDPGLGFGKTGSVNFSILQRLNDVFAGELEGFPVMIGASRKRFVRDLANDGSSWTNSEYEAMVGTAAVTAASIARSSKAQFHRVHDVAELKRVVDICDRIFRT